MLKPVVTVVFFCLLFNITPAQENEIEQNKITVTGSIELIEVADEASFNFTVKGIGESLRQAVEDAENKTKVITNKLMDAGIKSKNISTSSFTSGQNYGDQAFLSSSRDYKAIIVTQLKIDSLDLLKPLLFIISESGVENISNISFSYKNEVELRRRARVEAGLKAKEKAEDYGKELGIKIGKVLEITEAEVTHLSGQAYPNPFNSVYIRGSNNEASLYETKGSGFFAQTVSVTSQVRVTFAIE